MLLLLLLLSFHYSWSEKTFELILIFLLLIEDWLKLKADYIVDEKGIQGFGDSLDVIIIGAKYGRGTRSTSYGSFLCGMRTEEGVGRNG